MADELARSETRRLLVLAPDDAHTLLHIFPRLGVALTDLSLDDGVFMAAGRMVLAMVAKIAT